LLSNSETLNLQEVIMKIKGADPQVLDYEVINDANTLEPLVLIKLEFDKQLKGTEILLSREEILYMLDALNGAW